MELFGIGSVAIVILIGVMVFRKPLKKINEAICDNLDTEIIEDKVDLIKRANEAYQDLVDEYADGFKSIDEVLRYMNKKQRKVKKSEAA